MANDENSGLGLFKNIFEQQEEERRLRAEEFQIRYEERKRKKREYRNMIENSAINICEAAEKAAEHADELPPEELARLAAAINGAALAMQAAEQYAEYTPYYNGGFCAV